LHIALTTGQELTTQAAVQVWFEGGSFEMDRCEVAYNDDDLSDVFTWMGYTCANADSDSSMFAMGPSGIRWQPGNTLCLYDCRSLEQVATACIKAIDPCTDQSALEVSAPAQGA